MGRKSYDKAVEILQIHKGKILPVSELRRIVMMTIGSDPRTITHYLMMMRETGIIKEIENMRFKILGSNININKEVKEQQDLFNGRNL